jgi:hypothetical protein
MRIGIATYRTLSVLLLILLVLAVWLATEGRWTEATVAVTAMVLVVVGQALMLRCQHCGARPGLWLLALWTVLLSPEIYIADTLSPSVHPVPKVAFGRKGARWWCCLTAGSCATNFAWRYAPGTLRHNRDVRCQ